mgnify:CR=1 FL=1
MNVEPEQRAALLGEYIAEHSATVRAAARAFGCSKSTVHKDVSTRLRAWMRPCLPGCRPCWPATRPSAICGAGRRPDANTKSRRAVQGGLCRSPVYLCRNCSSAAFSSRETCAWLMPISRATSIWVSPLR